MEHFSVSALRTLRVTSITGKTAGCDVRTVNRETVRLELNSWASKCLRLSEHLQCPITKPVKALWEILMATCLINLKVTDRIFNPLIPEVLSYSLPLDNEQNKETKLYVEYFFLRSYVNLISHVKQRTLIPG
jgi:hypothetical protein